MDILYQDAHILVCIKPAGVLSTDEPGGLPSLLREALGNPKADVRTVHRLDRVVSGVMVLARSGPAASELSRQIRDNAFEKTYLAVLHGVPPQPEATLTDLLGRDKARKMTFVSDTPGKGILPASLSYSLLAVHGDKSLVSVRLHTGRTHQIRVQFASRGLPLVGERKYMEPQDDCRIALWSHTLSFCHPVTGEALRFSQEPAGDPWTLFGDYFSTPHGHLSK